MAILPFDVKTRAGLWAAMALPWVACPNAMAAAPDVPPSAAIPAPLVVARVNGVAIDTTRLDMIRWQTAVRQPGQAVPTPAQARDYAIDLDLQAKQAVSLGLDRHPRVQALLELARQEVLARAYIDFGRARTPEPTPVEVDRYHAEHPELFSERKVYQIQELILEPTSVLESQVRQWAAKAANMTEMAQVLKREGVNFLTNQVTQPAEGLPLDQLRDLAQAKEGKPFFRDGLAGVGMAIYAVAASRFEPMSKEVARPLIRRFLSTLAHQALQADALKVLRQDARIERLELPPVEP